MPVFNQPDVLVSRNRVVFPEFDYLQRNLELNNERYKGHIQKRTIHISNGNLLSQLIRALPEIEKDESENIYFNRIVGQSYGLLTTYGLVHEGGFGKSYSDSVYTGISEYFMAIESDYINIPTNTGLTIISHPYVGNTIPKFTEVETTDRIRKLESHIATFTIDLPLLVLNYVRYVKKENAKLKQGESLGNPVNKFLQDVVYPDLVTQHADISFFNGLTRLITGESLISPKGFTDISLPNFDRKTDDMLDDYFDYIVSNATSLEQILQMSLPSGKIIWDLILDQHDKITHTAWFYYLANHRAYAFILLTVTITGLRTDDDLIDKFKYEVKTLRNYTSVLNHMTPIVKERYRDNIQLLETYLEDI